MELLRLAMAVLNDVRKVPERFAEPPPNDDDGSLPFSRPSLSPAWNIGTGLSRRSTTPIHPPEIQRRLG